MADRFKLRVQCEIQKVDEHGGWTSDRLSVNDEMTIEAAGFFEVAEILGQFHALGETIRIRKGHDHG